MDEHDTSLMAQYGITAEDKVLFHYDGHRYERLADAVNYAKLQQTPAKEPDASVSPGHES